MKSESIFSEFLDGEVWAMEPVRLESFRSVLASRRVEIAALARVERKPKSYQPNGDNAIIPITGVLMKSVPWYYSLIGIDATQYSDIVSMIEQALADLAVKSITFDIDSPGGQVSGQIEAANAIRDAGKAKPTNVRVNDLAASGAYWLASQGGKITAGPNAMIGSIGVYTYFYDYSKMAENIGIKAIVIRSGEHKGMGIVGDKITDTQIEAMQAVIDGMASNFMQAISAGRNIPLEKVATLANGQIWIASAAKSNGLIDDVVSSKSSQTQKGKSMEENQKSQVDADAIRAETVASEKKLLGELVAAFPTNLQFAVEQYMKGADLVTAKAAFADVLAKENAELTAKLAESAKKPEAGASAGAPPAANTGNGEPKVKSFTEMAKEYAAEHKCSMQQAMSAVNRENPGLYK